MRTKIDINENQCDRCGKIVKDGEGDLSNYDDMAICGDCYNELSSKQEKTE
jgi:hypothetical protein